MKRRLLFLLCLTIIPWVCGASRAEDAKFKDGLTINELEYLEMPGLNVMLAHDFYPEGHQGGVGVIQNGRRVATNGDPRDRGGRRVGRCDQRRWQARPTAARS